MTRVKDFDIEQEILKRDDTRKAGKPANMQENLQPPITTTIFIPRYINYDDGRPTKTIQDFGWHPNVERGHTHLVHYCDRCKCQRSFTISSEVKKISKAGQEYVVGYYGYCGYCQENQ